MSEASEDETQGDKPRKRKKPKRETTDRETQHRETQHRETQESGDERDGAASTGAQPDQEPNSAPQASDPPRKRRRRKRKRSPDQAGFKREELDPNGRERPRFLLDFPEDPDLERLIVAFEAGNYHLLRELAPSVIEQGKSAEVRSAARELRRRIEPDPLLKYLLLATLVLLGALVWYAYARHGAHAH